MWEYYEQTFTHEFETINEMGKFLEKSKLKSILICYRETKGLLICEKDWTNNRKTSKGN